MPLPLTATRFTGTRPSALGEGQCVAKQGSFVASHGDRVLRLGELA